MRKIAIALTAVSSLTIAPLAQAADIARAQPVYKAAPAFTSALPVPAGWSGFYLGGQIGYGWADSSGTQGAGGTFFPVVPYTVDSNGVLGGAHAGYNYQVNSVVMGIEADIEAAHIKGLTALPAFGNTYYFNADVDMLASIRGRLGWAHDNWMIYGTGGVAFGRVSTTPLDTLNGWRTGWTLGGGVEHKSLFGKNWSTTLEYRYTDLGRESSYNPVLGTTDDNTLAIHAVRLGLSYHFTP